MQIKCSEEKRAMIQLLEFQCGKQRLGNPDARAKLSMGFDKKAVE